MFLPAAGYPFSPCCFFTASAVIFFGNQLQVYCIHINHGHPGDNIFFFLAVSTYFNIFSHTMPLPAS
jgi:hypothetical protein